MALTVSYASSKLEKQCTQAKEMNRAFDQTICKSLRRRMGELKSAARVQDLLDGPGKWLWKDIRRVAELRIDEPHLNPQHFLSTSSARSSSSRHTTQAAIGSRRGTSSMASNG